MCKVVVSLCTRCISVCLYPPPLVAGELSILGKNGWHHRGKIVCHDIWLVCWYWDDSGAVIVGRVSGGFVKGESFSIDLELNEKMIEGFMKVMNVRNAY